MRSLTFVAVDCSYRQPCAILPHNTAPELNVSYNNNCSYRHLRHLRPNHVKLNVSYNNITSLGAVGDDPSYEHLRQLFVDHNDVTNIVALEGTKFIDNFMVFSISHNKLKTVRCCSLFCFVKA
ncbi:hypothetical protein evm_014914 [Chilo suppressalis]|nr:hypothetical protein evm_014914 [Chilo suppressalis]